MEITDKDSSFLIQDTASGDPNAQRLLTLLSKASVDDGLKRLLNNPQLSDNDRQKIMTNLWRMVYRVKPPTIEEFLTADWIGPISTDIYPHVKDILTTFYHPHSTKRHLLLAMPIGTGKSRLSALAALYVFTRCWCMHDPRRFFGLDAATTIVYGLISFTQEKARQLLLQPFIQILETSPRFIRVKQEQHINKRQKDYPENVVWTSAGKMGPLQFYNDLHAILTSSPQGILGLGMIGAIMSELSFFIEQGFSPEYIWRIYQDAKQRVKTRFKGYPYLSGTIMDSSPNDMELSPIDRYIFGGDWVKDPLNMTITGRHWDFMDFQDDQYEHWLASGRTATFPVFRGSGKAPPRVLAPDELTNVAAEDIYHVPIDLRTPFEENTTKAVKDWCGWPGGAQERLLRDESTINSLFVPTLKNVYTFLYVDSRDSPEKLIWNQVRDSFWLKHGEGQYEFYRSSQEKRYIHIDQSETGDITGISMVHPEINRAGELVVIADFTLAVAPRQDGRINLQAIPLFVEDLRNLGGINIACVSFDMHQSSFAKQYLKDAGFNVQPFSVDRTTAPYLLLFSFINTRRVRVGRNIFLKNNLRSLQEVREGKSNKKKINHVIGKLTLNDGANWSMSEMGKNAKDVSDSLCGAVSTCLSDFNDRAIYTWEEPKLEVPDGTLSTVGQALRPVSEVRERVLNHIRSRHGLVPKPAR